MELRHLNTTFHIQHTTNWLQGKKSELYLLYTLKNIFWMRNLNHKWTKSKPFFPTFGHFIQFSEKGGEAVPPASCGPLNNPLFSYLFKTMSWISIKVFFSKCDQIGRKLQSFSHLLKKSLKENLILYLFLLRRNREFFFSRLVWFYVNLDTNQPLFTCSMLVTEAPEQCLKYVES